MSNLTFEFKRTDNGNWIGTSNHEDEPFHGAEVTGLSIKLEPAGEVNGRKAWHVDIQGEIIEKDDTSGHAPPTRGKCKNCTG